MDDQRYASVGTQSPLERLMVSAAAILEAIPDAVVAAARDGRIVFVNSLAEQLFGYTRAELVGRPVETLWPERVREHYLRNMALYFETDRPFHFSTETWGLRRDGSEFAGEMSFGTIDSGEGPLLLAIGRDITARRVADARVRAVARLGERALGGADPANLAAEAVDLLRDTLPLAGVTIRLADEPPTVSDMYTGPAGMVLPLGTGDELLVAPMRTLADDEMSYLRAVAHTLSVALARLREEERIRHDSVHDPLTGLPNRTLLRSHLERALARSQREGTTTGVLFVDLDGFKQVNDLHGHSVGDAVLVEVGARMRAAVRPTDTVARVGGDEFVVVCEPIDEPAAFALSRRLLEAISAPLQIAGVQHDLSASIGIALGCSGADAMLRDADSAGYRAKAGGRSRVELYRRPG
jgi:diguanylate cyclase (GGDEF)-like protein/PAS domain S-box-containing protein